MRAQANDAMPASAVVQRVTLSSDGMGGASEAWAAVGTATARVSPNGAGSDTLLTGRPLHEAPWVVTLPYGTDVTERDRIVAAGMTLEVVDAPTAYSYETCVRVACAEVA